MTFDFDGTSVPYRAGQTVAAALWATGRRAWRVSVRRRQPRGYYCGDGFCHDCLVVVDGQPNLRACQTRAEPASQVTTQTGFGSA
ncbi:MAG: (2Fe-2S)-binding protein [Chloroflexota bacterium]|nr:(2Fe-2S)-binding protein [Chloroflexota bacterium]